MFSNVFTRRHQLIAVEPFAQTPDSSAIGSLVAKLYATLIVSRRVYVCVSLFVRNFDAKSEHYRFGVRVQYGAYRKVPMGRRLAISRDSMTSYS